MTGDRVTFTKPDTTTTPAPTTPATPAPAPTKPTTPTPKPDKYKPYKLG